MRGECDHNTAKCFCFPAEDTYVQQDSQHSHSSLIQPNRPQPPALFHPLLSCTIRPCTSPRASQSQSGPAPLSPCSSSPHHLRCLTLPFTASLRVALAMAEAVRSQEV